jgi:glucosamine 6-phosphate synthetase-like amidotransferase/phosphosugar isomerase protein
MCGVFGFVSRDGCPVNPKVLARVALATQRRGPHAWGLAWLDGKARLHCYKQTGKVSDALGLLKMAQDARLLIGHCRYATMGDPANNLNNHPHSCDGGWLVHNGVIPNYAELVDCFGLHPVTGCDSEVLGLLIEQEDGDLLDRAAGAVLCVPRTPLVLLGLWKPGRLIAARQGNPLHTGTTGRGVYLASLAEGLPGKVVEVADNQVVEYGEGVRHVTL